MFYTKSNIDTRKISDYSLLAGLHCQSVLTDRFSTASELFHLRDSFACKLLVPSRCGRAGEGHLRVCWGRTSLSTLFRSATIEWSKEKKEFSKSEILNGYKWMKQNLVIPL